MGDYSFDAFLSYAHNDIEFARQVVGWLRQSGYSVWFDEEQLVPGTSFRAGFQQGLRESRHLVVILTNAYVDRHWTQREIDLFDLDADRSERKLLAIQIDNLRPGILDQVFLVYQRVPWAGQSFDAEAFWKLTCGLNNVRPGPRSEWKAHGIAALKPPRAIPQSTRADVSFSPESPLATWRRLAQQCLDLNSPYWQETFTELRAEISKSSHMHFPRHLIREEWALGKTELAAVFSLGMTSRAETDSWTAYRAWPFIDLACPAIAAWFLAQYSMAGSAQAEIWFTWAIYQERWELLIKAADKAPVDLDNHFGHLAECAISKERSFATFEANYDYGVMITPWNHFHLSWLADRLGDAHASTAHAEALCAIAGQGDHRAARFINRLTTWPGFAPHRQVHDLDRQLANARQRLGLIACADLASIQSRLSELWDFTQKLAGRL